MRFTNNRLLRTVSLLVVLAVLIATLGGCFPDRAGFDAVKQAGAKAQAKAVLAKLAKERSKPSTAQKLTDVTKNLQASLAKIAGSKAGDKAALRAAKTKLAALDKTIREEFQQTEAKITKINAGRAIARHTKVVADFNKKLAKLNRGINDVIAADNKTFAGKAKLLSDYLATLIPEEKHQPLGSSLPHRNVDYNAGEPILGSSIAPAYMATAPNLEPSTLPRTPTADDLASTVDTSQTEAIKDLADKLDKDPVKMYEFVRNNIIYEPYYGSRKGAQETLWEKGGNDIDQANLLIALYRYSGIPARYVTGVVEIPIDQAMNWVGVEKPEVAAKVFSAAGIPSKAMVSGGKISAIQIEHTWVEGYVNYDNYGGHDLDGGDKAWVPLGPAFKQYEYKKPINIKGILGLDASRFATTDTALLEQRLNEATAALSTYINQSMTTATLGDVIGEKKIVKDALGLLPSMPLAVVSTMSEQNALVDSQRYQLALQTGGLNFTASLPELAGKRVSIYYSPATQEDADLVASSGSLLSVPAYLIKVKPVVMVDGQARISGNSMTLGDYQNLSVTIQNQTRQEMANKVLTAGAYYSVGLDLGNVPPDILKASKHRLQTNIAPVSGETGEIDADEINGELLNLTALTYFAQVDNADHLLANINGTAVYKEPSVAVPSFAVSTAYLFGAPASVRSTGPDFDSIINPFIVEASDGDNNKAKGWTISSGYMASGAEHTIFNELYKAEAVSTVKILALANQQGIPIHQITGANVDIELNQLLVSPEIKDVIRNSINQGRVVTVPEREITFFSWTGTGWIDMDPVTGAAGYMIQGGLAGGAVAMASEEVASGLGVVADMVGAQLRRIDYFDQYGNSQFRYQFVATGQFAETVLGQALEVLSLIIMPLVDAIFQYLNDMSDPNLTDTQKLQRTGAVFVVMAAMTLGISMLVTSLGPVAGPIVGIFLSFACARLWDVVSKTVLDYYFAPTSSLRRFWSATYA